MFFPIKKITIQPSFAERKHSEHFLPISTIFLLFFLFLIHQQTYSQTFTLSASSLQNKIKGGWAAQTIGCTYGGPTEFKHQGSFIPDFQKIPWYDGYMKWWYDNQPGLYDDIYMDLTFVDIFEKEGLDAPAMSFARAFANADYSLWHANQAARYNILNGINPPESGHWLNNPHSDDIDFQIEADFAGLMCPGMVNTATDICDKIGHIMNFGDGWYGGVFVAAMYSLAFISDDVNWIVNEAIKTIPTESLFARTIQDVIQWHHENPQDWHLTWLKVHNKWSQDIGCPDGVFSQFNIDAKINSAWIVLALLYGEKDFGKTIDIATRAGDDSDCNPASAGGILGTILGYDNIPAYWKQGLTEVESMNFKYTSLSLNKVYDMSYRHALQVIQRNSGSMDSEKVTIQTQNIKPVNLEIGFAGHIPKERRSMNKTLNDKISFEFEGIGFVLSGAPSIKAGQEYVFEVEMVIDNSFKEHFSLPTNYTIRRTPLCWKYQLLSGTHNVTLTILNPVEGGTISLNQLVIYDKG